jgi:hypothetical protein
MIRGWRGTAVFAATFLVFQLALRFVAQRSWQALFESSAAILGGASAVIAWREGHRWRAVVFASLAVAMAMALPPPPPETSEQRLRAHWVLIVLSSGILIVSLVQAFREQNTASEDTGSAGG